jgi:aminocarboxymuconate-semialdehyde decarboxylase
VGVGTEACVREVRRLKGLCWMREVVLGSGALGCGLHDERVGEIYTALEEEEMPVFLHPNYGLPLEVYGSGADEYGHVLPLAMG